MSTTVPRQSVVVRTYAPVRRIVVAVALVLLAAFACYFVYELGRYDAGYDRMAVAQQRVEREVVIEHLEKANRELRTHLAELDTVRIGRAREQAEVARTIGDLQAQVARQTQDLAFFRGIVGQGAAPGPGLKIQQLRIAQGDGPSHFHVHLALIRTGRSDDTLNGALALSVDGDADGSSKTLTLSDLTGGKQRELPITFRYFENFDLQIELPSGFRPAQLTVEVRSGRKGLPPLTQTFLWNVE